MYGWTFSHWSTLHSSTEFRLGGSVYGWTQEFSTLQTPGAVWWLDYTWTNQEFRQLVADTYHAWRLYWRWPALAVPVTIFEYNDFQRVEINGNTFYTIAQDKKSTNQNSGVRFDAETKTGKETYYGYIQDIWELDYRRGLKVPLFRCKWVNMTRYGVTEDP